MSHAVALTFDVDGPAGLACRGDGDWAGRLTSVSEARYGLVRGVSRILAVLEEYDARATFYAPGVTVEQDPGVFSEILAAGHEIAHHGHRHLPSHRLGTAGQRDEFQRGLDALAARLGVRPSGYRSPAWELTPATLALVAEHELAYDSSLMDDDRPYTLAIAGRRLVELPVHWSLDDVAHFAGHVHPDAVARIWTAEADIARAEDRLLTLTMHPDVTGRPHRMALVHRLLDHLGCHGTLIVTHEQAAADARASA
jgi:peptidoglycan/xylan/chitin deacetylase (PgdA/CDA1 family)